MNKLICLISATEKEGRAVLKTLRRIKDKSLALPVYQGKIGKTNIIHIISGIGKTNAAHAATLIIEKFSPAAVINFGIGGAYPSANLRIGDIAIADNEIYGDEGLWLKDGFYKADEIGIPLLKKGMKKYFNEFPLDKNLVKKAMKVIPPNPPLAKGGDKRSPSTAWTNNGVPKCNLGTRGIRSFNLSQ